MKVRYALAMAALSGTVVGFAVHTLHAQGKPPVYMVAMNEVTDPEGYRRDYLPTALKTIKDHGGVYVAAGQGTQVDGSLPKGRVGTLGKHGGVERVASFTRVRGDQEGW
jgi:uncharacterized protein DUF1330